ncbi:STAS domain-containing protein [Bacillus salitolerans]|uniref:STAS domain-containing protein n=1 Tax=Bacillus salitolerans TaxID=1437434 RepID=A0ABW4LS27_9BACI
MGLSINIDRKESELVIHLKGILDISTSYMLDEHLKEIVSPETVIIDFKNLEFIDSTGIGSIINAAHISIEKHFTLILQGMNEFTDEVFEEIGVYQIIKALQKI